MIPRATVRLQFHRGFTFANAETLVPYFARLGVSHLYASPIAVARPGSMHGYDVIDPTTVNPELGGEVALRSLAAALAAAGLGPKVLLPILGKPLEETLAAGEIEVDREELRYFSHHLPLAPGGSTVLREVLERQHYRLASWRTAGDCINWRRFFDINELVSLRMDESAAFDAVHALPLRLCAEGILDGLRVDHVDGLADPAAYCRTLRRRLGKGAYLVVEKILLRGETLPRDWDCEGTTGYDFMNDVSALQHDAVGETCLAEAWAALSGRPADFAPEEQAARREIVARSFSAQLEACATALPRSEIPLPTRCRVLTELLAHFPVYRTYGTGGAVLERADGAVLQRAAEDAHRTCLATDRWAVDAVVRLLATPAGNARALVRFQQLSAPVAAKAVEDTAFYRYGRLLSRNDVGFDVETFASDAAAFHARVALRAAGHPQAMLATATHDHKRGEDVRARLAVLSSMAREWAALQARWVEASAPLRTAGAPCAGDIALLLQTVVGAWPLDLDVGDGAARTAFAERLAAWQQKALREAKLFSDWAAVDETYEGAARRFTLALISDAALPDLLQEIAALVRRVAPAGAVNGLVQCLLRLTVPGVPDLYQGTEFWDFSLVDPDNRRPVDYSARAAALGDADLPALAAEWRNGRIKQALIAELLALRRRVPDLFAAGSYEPVTIEGRAAESMIAFVRRHGDHRLLVAAPRLPLDLLQGADAIALAPQILKDTVLRLDGGITLDRLCTTLPFALLKTPP
jgi:(1->4)-alpha-D-glucan 1-alpha-D-glucosylmutase